MLSDVISIYVKGREDMKEKEKKKEVSFWEILGLNTLGVIVYFLTTKVFRGKFVFGEFALVFVSSIIITILVYYFGNKKSFEPMSNEAYSLRVIPLIRPLIFVVYWIMCFVLTRLFAFIF